MKKLMPMEEMLSIQVKEKLHQMALPFDEKYPYYEKCGVCFKIDFIDGPSPGGLCENCLEILKVACNKKEDEPELDTMVRLHPQIKSTGAARMDATM